MFQNKLQKSRDAKLACLQSHISSIEGLLHYEIKNHKGVRCKGKSKTEKLITRQLNLFVFKKRRADATGW